MLVVCTYLHYTRLCITSCKEIWVLLISSIQLLLLLLPSVLWCCWLGSRRGIRPVKMSGAVLAGYLSGEYGPADPITTCSRKSRLVLVLPFWCQLARVVLYNIQRHVKWL